MRIQAENRAYRIGEVMALSDTAYYAYRRELQNRPPAEGNRREPEGGRTFLLAMGEDGEDGVVVDLTGGRYEGLPAFVPDARKQLDAHIASIAEYCVREGVENTENGEWSITYEELYFQFDGTTLTSRNGMGRLLQEKLRQREEVNALIMTEDCIEMSYHLEYCPNCQRGGLAGAMNLLSLMGCNLYDLHLECGQDSEEPYLSPPLDRLTADTLTEYGKRDWADVMKTKVTGIAGKHGRMTVSLTGCSAEWLRDFCGLLLGDTNQGYYEQCVAMPDMVYGKAGEQPSDLRDSRVSDLIATYEELFHVQRDERITHYFGDYGSHFFNMGVTDQEIQPVYEKALAVMEMDDAIEAREGMDIPRIFQQRGEAWFRKVETDVLQEAAVRGNTVVSCGGGVPLKPENVAVMRKSGTVIMLSASPGEIYERVKESDRPLLKGNMNTDYIAGLMEKREGCYKAAADKEVETGGRQISEIIQEIVQFCLQK